MIWWLDASSLLFAVAMLAAWLWLPWPAALGLVGLLAAWLTFTRGGRQARSVTWLGLGTLGRRLGSAAVIVVGIAGVVGVLVSLLAMAEGYADTLQKTGTADTAIVTRGASGAEIMSVLDRTSVDLIGRAPGVARNADGAPIASGEIVVVADVEQPEGGDASVPLRGVGPAAWDLRPHLRMVSGRRFKPGLNELIAGRGVAARFAGLAPGEPVRLGGQTWTVVGVFDAEGAAASELWSDAAVVADAYRRGGARSSVTVRLESPAAFGVFKTALESNAQLKVDVSTTLDYFAQQSERTTRTLEAIGLVVGSIMAIGAVFGALNTMFTAVSTRAREIATLRAIGFGGRPVVAAVLIESLLLALGGGALGGLVAWLLFDGYKASTLAAGSAGTLSFALRVSPELLWTGAKWALAIGFVGGLLPALRAARQPVTVALRES